MKTALVTGADRGLGYCLVCELLQKDYTVFAGKFLGEYDLLERLQEKYPQRLHIVQMDMESRASIQHAYDEVCKKTDHMDLLISNAAFMGGPNTSSLRHYLPIDYDLMEKSVRVNAVGALQMAEIFLPLMDQGTRKRMCFISSEVSSINMMQRNGGYRYCMSKSALNIAVRILYNSLFDDGYTFRLFQPGWMRRMNNDGTKVPGADLNPEDSAAVAIEDFLHDRPDEQRLVLTDYMRGEWAF